MFHEDININIEFLGKIEQPKVIPKPPSVTEKEAEEKVNKIRLGSVGEEVKAIQRFLGVTPDGQFGPTTEEAVRRWQASEGLGISGVVDQESWNKMFPANP